jgi:ribosomal protein S18 acetylase RimI-like enzyme
LAIAEGSPVGCVALRKLEDDICEMKRLYLQPGLRGQGIGRRLTDAIIQDARGIGYEKMRLGSLASLQEATALYRSLGFVEIPPYRFNPLSGAVFMELVLQD